jgi:hypothetical protein
MHKTFCFIVLFWIGMYPLLAQNTSKRQQELESLGGVEQGLLEVLALFFNLTRSFPWRFKILTLILIIVFFIY